MAKVSELFEGREIEYTVESHWVDFKVYETNYGYAGPVRELYLEGSIKWDGCSNWNFCTDACMKHFCGQYHAVGIGRLLHRVYDITIEHLPTFTN